MDKDEALKNAKHRTWLDRLGTAERNHCRNIYRRLHPVVGVDCCLAANTSTRRRCVGTNRPG